MRDQFLVELTEERAARIEDVAQLNQLFTAWIETVCHRAGSTRRPGQPPLARRDSPAVPRFPPTGDLHEAFWWSKWRTVTKTSGVLYANQLRGRPRPSPGGWSSSSTHST